MMATIYVISRIDSENTFQSVKLSVFLCVPVIGLVFALDEVFFEIWGRLVSTT